MKNLLKADFKRVLKDKLLIVMGILAVVFAAMTPMLYAVLFSGIGLADDPMLSGFITAKAQFFASFSIGNNLGLIAPVLLAIALCKDFSFGTIRNKIIAGKSRSAIYLSLFVTCSVVLIAVMLLHAFLTLGISLIFFDYQATAFTAADFGYFMASLGFSVLSLLFFSSLISYLCANAKNAGLVIVLYIAVTFILVIVGSITQTVLSLSEVVEMKEITRDLIRFFDRVNPGNCASYIGRGTEYTLTEALYLAIPSAVGTLAFTLLGLWRFGKKDLK